MKNKLINLWEWILDKTLDRRVSVTKVAKPEDLVISNASLKQLKRGIKRVYDQVYGAVEKDKTK